MNLVQLLPGETGRNSLVGVPVDCSRGTSCLTLD